MPETTTWRSRTVVLPDGERPATVTAVDGRITSIGSYDTDPGSGELIDLGDRALLPGLVDTHVHVNEPGRTHWEGFETATRAAAAGGVTTIVDMPLNSVPPTVNAEALALKRAAARPKAYVDVGFWGGLIPSNLDELSELADGGVFAVKCFTAPSGVDEFPSLGLAALPEAFARATALGLTIGVHAEDPSVLDAAPAAGTDFAGFVASRPVEAERRAVAAVIDAAARTGARVHILHVSSADTAAALAAARADGLAVSGETCPHYLCLAAEQVADGATAFKCCPPIRDAANREALWAALARGDLDCVVSDHSPCPPDLKAGDFDTAWGGIASVQLGLSLLWTEAGPRGFGLSEVTGWLAAAPARLFGLRHKGRIAVGADADLIAFDPHRTWTVDAAALAHRHPISPYHGKPLTGAVTATWLRGRRVGEQPTGRLLSTKDVDR